MEGNSGGGGEGGGGGPGRVDFATHHSLAFGHFLVFDCKWVDLFEVIICDKSTLEISYPTADLPNPSDDGVSGYIVSQFTKIMTPSDITGKQTIGIPAWFVNENRSWFSSRHDHCSIFAAGKESENCRISWNHREGRWEGAICSGGWKFAVKKLKPSVGDTVEFKLDFDNAKKIHSFNTRILETGIADGVGKLKVGSSSRSKRRALQGNAKSKHAILSSSSLKEVINFAGTKALPDKYIYENHSDKVASIMRLQQLPVSVDNKLANNNERRTTCFIGSMYNNERRRTL
ncbi:hypothetical protein ACFE04_027280 [Oxalis oulophora]